MLYGEYIFKAKDLVVQQLDNGNWYLEPDWKDILCRNNLDLNEVSDSHLESWYELEDVLVLEVDRRNARDSKKEAVINWLYDLITSTVEPAVLQEETDYIKNVMDYMKATHDRGEIK